MVAAGTEPDGDPKDRAAVIAAAEAADVGECCAAFRAFLADLSPERKAELRRILWGRAGPRPRRIVGSDRAPRGRAMTSPLALSRRAKTARICPAASRASPEPPPGPSWRSRFADGGRGAGYLRGRRARRLERLDLAAGVLQLGLEVAEASGELEALLFEVGDSRVRLAEVDDELDRDRIGWDVPWEVPASGVAWPCCDVPCDVPWELPNGRHVPQRCDVPWEVPIRECDQVGEALGPPDALGV